MRDVTLVILNSLRIKCHIRTCNANLQISHFRLEFRLGL